jgi:uncharacterized protein YjiS (DUF1127 family)
MSMFNTVASKGSFDLVSNSSRRSAHSVGHAALAFAAAGFARVGRAVVKDVRTRRAVAELSRMDDSMLRDIGLARSDVDRVARYGRM